jgi:SAM-dependent methyltransferase
MDRNLIKLRKEFGAQTSLVQAEELYNAVLNTPVGCVVEIGSATGGTTVVLIEAALKVGKMVISVDPYPEEFEGVARDYQKGDMKRYREEFAKNILARYDNVVQFNQTLKECIDKIPSISVVFVDGCHEFSFVKEEYDLLLPKMVKGGRMYFHDMGFYEGQLTKEGGLTKFPDVVNGVYVEDEIESRLEGLQMMLKIEI